jgi:hypothetical protein
MNKYRVYIDSENYIIVKADKIRETDNVILFLKADEVIGVAPLISIAVVTQEYLEK